MQINQKITYSDNKKKEQNCNKIYAEVKLSNLSKIKSGYLFVLKLKTIKCSKKFLYYLSF